MAFAKARAIAAAAVLYVSASSAQNASVVQLSPQLLYNLPAPFSGINVNDSFLNTTRTSSSNVNHMLEAANNAPITSFDPDFSRMVGSNPKITLVLEQPGMDFAFEGGGWIPEKNQVWLLSVLYQVPTHVSILDLATGRVTRPNITGDFANPNGLWYDRGTMYSATIRDNYTYPGGVTAINTTSLQATYLTNTFFGRLYDFPDDLVITRAGNKKFLLFTDLGRGALDSGYPGIEEREKYQVQQNGGGVFRYDFQTKKVKQVLSIQDAAHPNGVRVSPDGRRLYVTSNGADAAYGTPIVAQVAASAVYEWDLTEQMVPVNKRLLCATPTGIADGMHVDDKGRIWTGEGDGVMVRSPEGDLLGIFNANYFEGVKGLSIANFALAGDTLVIGGAAKLWTVKLNETVVTQGSTVEN